MMNSLVQGQPSGSMSQPPAPDPADIEAFHGHADTYFNALQELAAKPNVNKEDVFKAVASLMGKGLFADPQSQQALIMQLTQMPDDEQTIRQMIGREMLTVAHVKNEMTQRFGNAGPGV